MVRSLTRAATAALLGLLTALVACSGDGDSSLTKCTGDAACPDGQQCYLELALCVTPLEQGASCLHDTQCRSKHCGTPAGSPDGSVCD